jgi:hypothetical protein
MLPIFYLNYLESGRKGISLPFCLIGDLLPNFLYGLKYRFQILALKICLIS